MPLFPGIESTAEISKDAQYRYFLSRRWDSTLPIALFIGLNPSTADAFDDDPTIRRCIGFARTWGCGTLWMVNLFAYRSTDPKNLLAAADPIGPDNDLWLDKSIAEATLVVAAWGNQGDLLGQASRALDRYKSKLQTLGMTKSGKPRHPLYVRGDTLPRPL